MSVNDTWMPLYLGDYLADTMHLGAAHHGAYLLLLMHYWRNGPLTNDDGALAAIARCDARLWRSVGPVIRGFFALATDGLLHQKRMDRERAKWSGISDKRREAGKAGAQAKWKPNGSHPPPSPQPPPTTESPIPWNALRPMANAIPDPVDNSGNRIANAIPLPSQNPGFDGKCHDFAIAPLPSKSYNILSFKETVSPPARVEAPSEADIAAQRRAHHEALAELPPELAAAVNSLASTIGGVAYAPGWSPKRTAEEQAAAVEQKRPKTYHLTPEQLRIARAAAMATRKAVA